MHQITAPTIKLYTNYRHEGTFISALILEYNGNNYHLHAGARDTIYVFTESLGIYVLIVNRELGYVELHSYMVPEPDPINSVVLHNPSEIIETLGAKWESLKPLTIVQKLINYLY